MPKVVSIARGNHRAKVLARRDALVEENINLVPPIARHIRLSLPSTFDLDDLISAGNVGLVQAATSYRPSAHGDVPFAAYARPRIRGAILDSVKRSAWAYAKGKASSDIPERSVVVNIEDELDKRRRRDEIDDAIANLGEREQALIHWHYAEGVTLAEVATRLGVGAPRTSQLHVAAVRELREALS